MCYCMHALYEQCTIVICNDFYSRDGVHPSWNGHKVLHEEIQKGIRWHLSSARALLLQR